jgi:hypothetical protein
MTLSSHDPETADMPDSNVRPVLPPRQTNFDGAARHVGVEVEFAAVSSRDAAEAIAAGLAVRSSSATGTGMKSATQPSARSSASSTAAMRIPMPTHARQTKRRIAGLPVSAKWSAPRSAISAG